MEVKKSLKIRELCQKNWLGLLLAVIFFVLYLWYMKFYVDNGQFNSPDESANYYFLQQLTNTGHIPVEQSEGLSDIVHPRSILVWKNNLVPISFPGLIYVLAPFYFLFGLWGVIVFYGLLFVFFMYLWWRWLNRENLSKVLWVLVATQPVLWYYLFHPLFNNVLSFLLGSSALLLLSEEQRRSKYIGVFFMILAWWVRPFDALYFGPILLLASIYYKVSWRQRLQYFVVIVAGSLFLFGISNYLVYGQPWLFGYTLPKPTGGVEISVDYWNNFNLFIKNVWDFLVKLFWPYIILGLLGMVIYLWTWRRQLPGYHLLFGSLLFGGGALVLFYGFGDFNDHVVKNNISIGGAFVRYWLPVYILLSCLAGLSYGFLRRVAGKYFSGGLLVCLAIFSFYAVWYRDNDSLMWERQNLLAGIQEKEILQKIIPEDAILVLDREDKYFFPERSLIHLSEFQDNYALFGIRDLLLDGKTIYYYGFTLGAVDWQYLHQQKLGPLKLRLKILNSGMEKSLYQFELYE